MRTLARKYLLRGDYYRVKVSAIWVRGPLGLAFSSSWELGEVSVGIASLAWSHAEPVASSATKSLTLNLTPKLSNLRS